MNFDGRSASFFAPVNEMVKCPHEGCEHIGQVITKAHCRAVHGIEREEVLKKYGFPYKVTYRKGVMASGN